MSTDLVKPHPATATDLKALFADTTGRNPATEPSIATITLIAWRKAQAGLRAIVEFGALLLEVEAWLKKRGEKRPHAAGQTSGLKAWLAENAPEVDYKTAMGYKYAASGLLALADKARDRPLLPLMGEQPLTDAEEEAAREQVLSLVSTSSLRLLKAAARADDAARDPADRNQGRIPLLAEGPGSIRRAAAETWGRVQRAAASFLSHKFALALKPKEAKAALVTVDALRDALRARLDEGRGA